MGWNNVGGIVTAVSLNPEHTFSKPNQEKIRLLVGLGVERDTHLGVTVQHRSLVKRDPTQLNLRQMGENITTRSVDLLGLPTGTRLHLGNEAIVEVTGLRNPCYQLDDFQQGLLKACLDHDEDGNLIRKAGVMGIVLVGGEVFPNDSIRVEYPPEPHQPLQSV